MHTIVTLDLETISPGYEPPLDDPDRFAPLPYHEIVVTGWQTVVLDGRKPPVIELTVAANPTPEDEAAHLLELGAHLKVADRIVTFNGRGFDMPLLGLRAMHHLIDWSFWPKKRHRYDRGPKEPLVHFDLMDQLCDQGGAHGIGLDPVAKLCGLPGKPEGIDGSRVRDLWPDRAEDIRRYCAEDVAQTWLIYLRWCRTFRGWSDAAEATEMAWWVWAIEQPLLRGFLERVKRMEELVPAEGRVG